METCGWQGGSCSRHEDECACVWQIFRAEGQMPVERALIRANCRPKAARHAARPVNRRYGHARVGFCRPSLAYWEMSSGRNLVGFPLLVHVSLAYWEMSSGRNKTRVQREALDSLAYWEMSSGRNLPSLPTIADVSLAYWEMSSGRNWPSLACAPAGSLAYWEMSSGRYAFGEPILSRGR